MNIQREKRMFQTAVLTCFAHVEFSKHFLREAMNVGYAKQTFLKTLKMTYLEHWDCFFQVEWLNDFMYNPFAMKWKIWEFYLINDLTQSPIRKTNSFKISSVHCFQSKSVQRNKFFLNFTWTNISLKLRSVKRFIQKMSKRKRLQTEVGTGS